MPRRERPPATPYQQALGMLVRREHSAAELRRKLRLRGVAEEASAASLTTLQQQGFQDDGRFASSLVRSRVAAGHGPGRIRAELQQRGISSELAAEALADVGGDWPAEARRLAVRRLATGPRDDAHGRKVVGFLCRRGFPLPVALAAVREALGMASGSLLDEDGSSD